VTDQSGALMERVYYTDAFGTPTFKNGSGATLAGTTTGTRFLFTGREWLATLSLYDYRNRTYSAELGRFIETDPIWFNAGDVNLYRYVFNRPIIGTDPMGLLFEWLPILGTVEQLARSFLNDYPGMKKEDYQAAAGNGEQPMCNNAINQELALYRLANVTPNVVRLGVDYAVSIALFAMPPTAIAGGVAAVASVIDSLIGGSLLVYVDNRLLEAAEQAKAEYCCPE